jgi:hypothetical protein
MRSTSLIIVLLLAFTGLSAQKIKVESGNLTKLKDQKTFNVIYEYSPMSVGKFKKEQDYVDQKTKTYNDDVSGSGDKWAKAWVNDRAARFEPKFEELFNKYLEDQGVKIGSEYKDAKYTMILHTTFTEPGFNIVISKKPAIVNVELRIVETANPTKVIAVVTSMKNTGTSMGFNDMDTGVRLTEAYAKCGKGFGKYFLKNVYK